MSKRLEALERIKHKLSSTNANGYWEDLDIIKAALKRLDGIDNGPFVPVHINRYIELNKKEQALEIIKEKGIILQFIKETYTVEQYNAGVFGTLVKPLTQEEYDLLKEVLS